MPPRSKTRSGVENGISRTSSRLRAQVNNSNKEKQVQTVTKKKSSNKLSTRAKIAEDAAISAHPYARKPKVKVNEKINEKVVVRKTKEKSKGNGKVISEITLLYGRRPHGVKPGGPINCLPKLGNEKLDVLVFGSGSMCELGLGPEASTKEVKRPRLNPFFDREKIGIVCIAVGGAHSVAIDHLGRLWSWGCNDHGALGRNTSSGEVLKDMKVSKNKKKNDKKDNEDIPAITSDSDDDDDGDLNALESTPALVEDIPDNAKFVSVAASDNMTVALTANGEVYSCGTFRCNEGLLGYSETIKVQRTLKKLDTLHHVVQISAGKDHFLALDVWGVVYSWGNGQQFQLGRRVIERTRMQTLTPREFGLRNITFVGSGEFHSFAISSNGDVYTWGLNQFGQCGVEEKFEDGAVISSPTKIKHLSGKDIVFVTGGEHHSLCISKAGELYTWGRLDSHEIGIEYSKLPDTVVNDARGKPRFNPVPTILKEARIPKDLAEAKKIKEMQKQLKIDEEQKEKEGKEDKEKKEKAEAELKAKEKENEERIVEMPKIKFATAGSHHSLAISEDGSIFSWGFGETYQVGQGPNGEDIDIPTKIVNTATKGENFVYAGAGGQFSVIGGIPKKNE